MSIVRRRSGHDWSHPATTGSFSSCFPGYTHIDQHVSSRMKKIKCHQPTPEAVPCEACRTAGISCRFRDRERYYAERSKLAAAQAASSKGSSGERSRKRSRHEPEPASASISSSQDQSEASTSLHGGPSRSLSRRSNSYHPYRVPSALGEPCFRSSPESDTSTPPPYGPLFCPNDRMKPHSQIMINFIQFFFDNLDLDFPFLAYDETIRQFFTRTLSRLLANCIAAHAVRFADIPEVTKRGVMYASDQYCDRAKVRPCDFPALCSPICATCIVAVLTGDFFHSTCLPRRVLRRRSILCMR